jgi:hypothetical protein
MGDIAEKFKEMMTPVRLGPFQYPVSAFRNRFEFAEKGWEVYAKT